MEPFKYKDDVLAAIKNYKALCKKQSDCQLKIIHIDGGRKYVGEFDKYFKENSITYKVTTPYSFE